MRRMHLRVSLGIVMALAAAGAASAQTYDLSWYSIDGGGATFSTGGVYELGGTIGQFDAGPGSAGMSGGAFTLVGGFWPAAGAPCAGFTRADANCDGVVDFFDIDPFILGLINPAAYAVNYPGCNLACVADANEDGAVDFFDIDPFVNCVLNSGCP